jgi:hypothetical protein
MAVMRRHLATTWPAVSAIPQESETGPVADWVSNVCTVVVVKSIGEPGAPRWYVEKSLFGKAPLLRALFWKKPPSWFSNVTVGDQMTPEEASG